MGSSSSSGGYVEDPESKRLNEEDRLGSLNAIANENALADYYSFSAGRPAIIDPTADTLYNARLNYELANQQKNLAGGNFDVSPYQTKILDLESSLTGPYDQETGISYYQPSTIPIQSSALASPQFLADQQERSTATQNKIKAQEDAFRTSFNDLYKTYKTDVLKRAPDDPELMASRLGFATGVYDAFNQDKLTKLAQTREKATNIASTVSSNAPNLAPALSTIKSSSTIETAIPNSNMVGKSSRLAGLTQTNRI